MLPEWQKESINDRYNIDGLLKSAKVKHWVMCLIAGAEDVTESWCEALSAEDLEVVRSISEDVRGTRELPNNRR